MQAFQTVSLPDYSTFNEWKGVAKGGAFPLCSWWWGVTGWGVLKPAAGSDFSTLGGPLRRMPSGLGRTCHVLLEHSRLEAAPGVNTGSGALTWGRWDNTGSCNNGTAKWNVTFYQSNLGP